MSHTQLGLLFCFAFVTLEAFQAVYLGSVFQSVDSFHVGSRVFGVCVFACTASTIIFRPNEIKISIKAWRIVLVLNVLAALTWATYSISIQLIEPAVAFTIFSGAVPLGTIVGAWLSLPEAKEAAERLSSFSSILMSISVLVLAVITIFGFSGFVRGGAIIASAGVTLAAVSGICTTFVILFSARLSRRGIGPLALFGLRFYLYTLVALAASSFGLDDKVVETSPQDFAFVVLVGFAVIALPLYLVQKAVPLIPAATIATITALGPVLVFFMQLFDGRTEYSTATLVGLSLYIIAALQMAYAAKTYSLPTVVAAPKISDAKDYPQ